jgi:hypothetical protein
MLRRILIVLFSLVTLLSFLLPLLLIPYRKCCTSARLKRFIRPKPKRAHEKYQIWLSNDRVKLPPSERVREKGVKG